jgi:anti-sigma regulatory factor (Ser/Thr protein kinase)
VTAPIRLTIPRDRRYHGVARLVLGGLAARLELSYEHLEDLQLALSTILEDKSYVTDEEVTVELHVVDDVLSVRIGPLDGERVRRDLETESGERIGLGRLLRTVVEHVEIESGEGGEWVRLEKRVKSVKAAESK